MLLLCPSICFAVANTPVQNMSADLGVTPQQFEQCMKSGKAAHVSGETEKGVVVQCLQKINPSITIDQFKATMMKYKPKPQATPNNS